MSEIITLLESKSVKPSAMRILVLEQFTGQNTAKSLHDLEQLLPHSDRITIYRTLKTFEQKGILHLVEDGSGVQCYARCEASCIDGQHQDIHPHFHCLRCKETVCMNALSMPKLQLPATYLIHDISLRIDGICPNCQ